MTSPQEMNMSQNDVMFDAEPQTPALTAEEQTAQLVARAALLTDVTERIRRLPQHPLNRLPVKILTGSIKAAFLEICGAVAYKRPGIVFTADFRVGKSTAVTMIREKLRVSLPHVAVSSVCAQAHKENATERLYWGDLLEALGLDDSGTAQDRKKRFVSAILAACREAGGTDFALLIDEGQNWGMKEYTYLRDVTNLLIDLHGISVTTVIFGDLGLKDLCSTTRLKRKDLWARFMMQPRTFHGIKDKEDLQFFLAEYDSTKRCEYPAGSGISYTEYFLPLAYANGWRLAKETDPVWDALARAAQSVGHEVSDVGMQWVGSAVTRFLTANLKTDVTQFRTCPDDWDQAVALSGYVQSLI